MDLHIQQKQQLLITMLTSFLAPLELQTISVLMGMDLLEPQANQAQMGIEEQKL